MQVETRNKIKGLIEKNELFEKKGSPRFYEAISAIADLFPFEYEGETELHTDQLRGEFEIEIELLVDAHGPAVLRNLP